MLENNNGYYATSHDGRMRGLMKKEKQTKNQNKGSFLGRKANLWITLCLIICMIVFFQKPQICYAASAQVNITGDVDECKVGDEIYVYIQVETDIPLGDFEANLTYDDSILEYKTGSPAISGGSGYLKISDMNIADDTYSKKYVVMFQVLEAGTVKVKLGEKAKVFDAENGNEMSVSSSGFTLTSTSVETASVNSDLESLRINPSTIEPEFSKDVYKYSATVPHDTEQLFISAIPADEKATVSIVGNEALQDGDNKIDIVVKAENGGTSTYTIRCYREIESQNKEDEENPDKIGRAHV